MSVRASRTNVLALLVLLGATLGAGPRLVRRPGAAVVPLCPGLTIVTAISRPEGDYESIKTVVDAGDRGATLAYSAQVPTERGSLRNWNMRRVVLRETSGRRRCTRTTSTPRGRTRSGEHRTRRLHPRRADPRAAHQRPPGGSPC